EGKAWLEGSPQSDDLTPLFETILAKVPTASGDPKAPFLFQVTNLDYSDYLGRLALGRILQGTIRANDSVVLVGPDKEPKRARITKVMTHLGLTRVETEVGEPGDIVVLPGLDEVNIGDSLYDPDAVTQLPTPAID